MQAHHYMQVHRRMQAHRPAAYSGSSDYACPSDYAGSSEYNDEDVEFETDSLLNTEQVDSELDEVEVEDQIDQNNDDDGDVSILVMMDVLGENAQEHFDLNMSVVPDRMNLYPVILFFNTTHQEVPADSIDIPTGSNLRKSMIAIHLLGMVRQDPSCDTKHVQQIVKDKFDFEVPYHKAWHALKAAREQVYGTWESSIQKLPKYIVALQKWNPGAVVEWLHLETNSPGMLNYIFWAFRPCIEGYHYCRDVISVDRTHLYTKYKHKMLVAVTLDANQQVLPLVFGLVDEESLTSWRWFLRMLSKYLLSSEDDRVCLISDSHAGLINAINYVPAFKFPRGVHRFCLQHVCLNFNTKFKNIQLKDMCWRAWADVSPRNFDRIMEEIKSLNEEAYDWLGRIDKAQWTLAHDGGWRTGILTTNMSECINGVLKGARRLPIMAIVQITLSRSVQYFLQCSTWCNRMINANQQWADFAFKLFEARQAEAVRHIVQKFDYN
ncbi:UNVERIFIED_CONTAM: hypothetical protein Sindi_0980100 [Sesamum indicum]